ncbi:hypothetical protein EXU57_00055 [Segetibacter sp. 3557_3]|uniref:hypothetical protein n=1 Tax=Segetibacter sp. 3557_3 TaxID=2547429 RepID=UPI001059149C|nr:hypothetical protein [Segetibacter sp. 3557_3]TDH28514.1 hypothetical protein EXU57_00055 [Segetibacter sp. 3557_3]
MKFDDLLAQYLYEHKRLELQQIGTFELDSNVVVPPPSEKDVYYPIEGLRFNFNSKASTTDDLIAFMVKRLGKIQPLVTSDLDSYLSNVRQFINLGKPYTIEGIGTLQSDNHGLYEFIPGQFTNVQYAREEPAPLRERERIQQARKPLTTAKPAGNNRALVATLTVLVLAAAAFGYYKFVYQSSPSGESAVAAASPTTNDGDSTTTGSDTTLVSARPALPATLNGNTAYKMIFEVTPSKPRALKRTAQLVNLKMPAKYDSITSASGKYFRMYLSVTAPPADTTRIRDSLYRIFAKRIRIEPQAQ